MKRAELRSILKEIVKGILNEMTTTGAMDVISTPKAFVTRGSNPKLTTDKDEKIKSEVVKEEEGGEGFDTGGAFSGKGGSKAGIAASKGLGYELTPIGKKQCNARAMQSIN